MKSQPIERGIFTTLILLVVTIGFYSLYLIYQWSKEMNYITDSDDYPPGLLTIISLITLLSAPAFLQVVYGYELQRATKKLDTPDRDTHLGLSLLILNSIAMGLPQISKIGIVLLIAVGLSFFAVCKFQWELNNHARRIEYKKELQALE